MFFRRRSERPASRGQALVEFALILPLLALLLVMALDFGRVFFAWVGIQNAARIGASYAAIYPLGGDWNNDADANTQEYVAQILADSAGINCGPPAATDTNGTWDAEDIPAPTFPTGTSPNDDAVVALTCDFVPITPLAAGIVGSPLEIGANATFPIRTGIVSIPGADPPEEEDDPLCRVVPDLTDMLVSDAVLAWDVAGFSGTAAYTGPTSRVVVSQVTNPASVPGQCITFTATVNLTSTTATTCPSGQARVPEVNGLLVSQARTRWTNAGFQASNFDPTTGSDDQVVTGWQTNPDLSAGACAPTATTTVNVDYADAPDPAPCQVPNFIGSNANQAQIKWNTAGFETTVQFSVSGNFKIGKQSITSGAYVSCTSAVILLEP